ncbi:MAG: amino acid adenylation domain-containing protein [Gordonia sp. (in: high G+C Gram-positive bacteria)]|uniref:amino acid adenylation domain-containing protein n=1 Tax=Gordonia sp. (in: high G+C Gram-positive bacteria) TaxID=84139 RepID=UPI0039E61D26
MKINGQRVELGEIEAVLAAQSGVAQAVVVGHDTEQNGRKHTRLVAYLITASGASIDTDAVAEQAGARLAAHMVPAQFLVIDEIPRTPAGKLDRDALPRPDAEERRAEYVAPETETERLLANILGGLLGVEQLSVTESFFALGGDSIMSIQVASAAKAAGLIVTPRDVFEHKTVRAIAAAAEAGGPAVPPLDEPEGGGMGSVVLPPIVSWMVDGASSPEVFRDFNQSSTLVAPDDITIDQLRAIVSAVVEAHPMPSARLIREGDGWAFDSGLPFDAVASVRVSDTDAEAAGGELLGRLDPAAGRLLEVSLVPGEDGAGRIVIVGHHLAVDAVSWPIIVEDFITGWAQLSEGRPIELRREAVSARAWFEALSKRDVSAELGYWLEKSPTTVTRFGTDPQAPSVPWSETESYVLQIPPVVTEPVLTTVPEAFRGSIDDVLLGTLARAVRRWQEDRGIDDDAPITVMTEGHGRYEDVLENGSDPRRADLSRTVGWFTTTSPLLVDPGQDVVHAVKAAKEERLGRPGHGLGYGRLRYGGSDELATRPAPSISFNYLGGRGGTVSDTDEGSAAGSLPMFPAADASNIPSTADGLLTHPGVLSINASTSPSPEGSVISADLRFVGAVLSRSDVEDIGERWVSELAEVVEQSRAGDPGLSPADVPGTAVTQADLDVLAERYPGADVWPLTPLQTGLFFLSDLAVGAVDVYVTQAVVHFGGAVDERRLENAAQRLLDEHRSLRSGFVRTASGVAVTVVPPTVKLPWRVVDLDGDDEASVHEAIREIADTEKLVPFDMSAPPLIRGVLVRSGARRSLVITNHHILFDGWSGPLVLADLLALYATDVAYTAQVRSGSADFGDFVTMVAEADRDEGRKAWAEVLAPVDEPTVVAAHSRVAEDTMPRELNLSLGSELTREIESMARERGVTVTTILQTGWAVLLSKMTGHQVVTFGETVSGRPATLEGVESMIGLFINTLPVVVDVDPARSIGEVIERLQTDKVKTLDHQHLSLAELNGIAGHSVLFDTLTVYESYPVDNDSLASVDTSVVDGALEVVGVEVTDATHYPLNLSASPTAEGIHLRMTYLPAVFTEGQAGVLASALTTILSGIVADPSQSAGDVPLVDPADAAAELLPSTAPAVEPRPLVDMLAARDLDPDKPAVIADGRVIGYREFEAQTNRVARALIADGIGPEDVVAVMLDRSVEALTVVWSVIKTGAAFVAIDPTHPDERIAGMLEDARSRIGVTDPASHREFSGVDCRWLTTDELLAVEGDGSDLTAADRNGPVRVDNLAYLVFTSGTTGRPKAAANRHTGLATLLAWLTSVTGTAAEHSDARILHVSSPSFDAYFFELLWALGAGHTLVVAPVDAYAGPALDELIESQRITDAFVTPSVLSTLDAERAGSLRNLIVGGESCAPDLVDKWAGPHRRMVNHFGPSEATVISSTAELTPGEPVTVGTSVRGFTAYVLDQRLHPVPRGLVGELYLSASEGLGRGYLRRPGMTATSFVADPIASDGSRMYATGDLVRINDDGALEFAGRSDFQVKINGQRIELAEIEQVLSEQEGVETAVVVGVDKSLIAYVVAVGDTEPDPRDLTVAAAQRLPGFMVPSHIVSIDELPLNTVGKLDLKALPMPEITVLNDDLSTPDTREEEAIAAVFADVLGLERVGVNTSFFDLGGNSLSATRAVAGISSALGVQLSVRDLFDAPTVRQLAVASTGKSDALPPVVTADPRPERIPLSFAQQRMWLINQTDTSSHAYNVPMGLRVTGPLDVDALRAAFVDVVIRHEVLRSTFPATEGKPHQVIAEESTVAAVLDWGVVDSLDELQESLSTGFDVTVQTPIRIRVCGIGADEYVIATVIHHIAFDGESMAPLVTDLFTAYLAEAEGRAPEFAALPYQFADFAIWQHEVLGSTDDSEAIIGEQLNYWREQLEGLPELVELPLDRPRPRVATTRGAAVGFEIPEDVTAGIERIAEQAGATSFMVVHAALAALYSRMTGQRDIAIGTPIAGRNQSGLDSLVGMFVNTLVLRTEVRRGITFDALLADTKKTDLDAYANADVPFETIVEATGTTQSSSFAPFTQIWLTFNQTDVPEMAGANLVEGRVGDLSISPIADAYVPAKVDVLVAVGQSDGAWSGSIVYATDLFDEATIQVFADHLVEMIEQIVTDPSAAVSALKLSDEKTAASVTGLSATPVPGSPTGERDARSVPSDEAVVSSGVGESPILLSGIFARTVAKWGPRQAVVDIDGSIITYDELDARSNRLARWLIARGLGSEDLVALAIGRSVNLLTAIWAVTKTGAGYVPIDPTYPADRVEAMVEDSEAALGLAVVESGELPSRGFDWLSLDSDETSTAIKAFDDVPIRDDELLRPVGVDDTAYVIFTSGSTGRPKGVAVTHSGLANFAAEESRLAESDERSRVLAFASPSFDASVLEYLLAAWSGGVLIYRPNEAVGGAVLQDFMMRQAVTHTFLTPSVLATLDPSMLPALRVVYAGGEAVPQALKDEWALYPRIQNLYGPTETTIGVAISEPMQVGDPVYLGGPIAGVGFLVLDDELLPVPVGAPGELYVCGDALSRGYVGLPALTASRFVANPYGVPGDRMYRTGDVVRWRQDDDGRRTLEYTGRSDDQVKLRGLRIELGEIETVLSQHSEVKASVVVGIGGSVATALAGYVVLDDGAPVDGARLRAYLAEHLPSHMVPSSITVLDALPLTPVGKLDKRALPEPVIEVGEYVAPEGDAEIAIAAVFAEVLGVDRVSATESFFDLGGNSLSAMRVVGRVAEALDAGISIADIFAAPTVRGVVRTVNGARAVSPVLALRAQGTGAPLFCVHPAGGLGWAFGGILPYVSDRPVFALQEPSVVAGEPAATSIRQLAERYVAEIREIQPDGPYHLLGWSMGGVIAYEMATIIRSDGGEVGLLGLMDSIAGAFFAAGEDGEATGPEDARALVRGMLGSLGETDLLDDLAEGSMDDVLDVLRKRVVELSLGTAEHVDRVIESFVNAGPLLETWTPASPAGSLLYFTATADKTDPTVMAEYWRDQANVEVENVDVDAGHFDLGGDTAWRVIGPAIERRLALLDGKTVMEEYETEREDHI